MATAAEILNDPNYVNANAATKKAIFDRRVAVLPEYRNANPATQAQIQTRFGISGQKMTGAKAAVSGFQQGIQTIGENLERFNPSRLVDLIPGVGAARRSLDVLAAPVTASQTATARQAQQQRPNYFAGGKMASEIAATVPIISTGGGAVRAAGGGLARVAPRSGGVVRRVGEAITTGGIGSGRTATQSAAMTAGQRGGRLLERVAGGAAGGAAGAALTDQDVTTGAAFGGGLPVVASVLKRVGGAVPDLFKLPTLKAADIVRKSLGENVDAARAAFAALPADSRELARQTLVRLGIEPRVFMAVAEGAERLRPDEVAAILDPQVAAREARLAGAAGGGAMEEIRAATRAGRQAVTEDLAPLREQMYERSGRASLEVPPALRTAQELEQQAAEQSGLARRMTFGAERAETRLGQADDLGDVFDPAAINRERGIAGAMTQRGEQAALGAIGAREEAGDIYQMVDDLAAQGMRPMRAADLISSLRSKMADPEILRGSLEERTIRNVIGQLEKATDQNGMLNPKALGKIRRSGINDIVNRLSTQMGGVPSRTGTPEAAQATVLDLRKMIDSTLREGGGGDLVDEFLQRSERGYAAVNRGQLSGEALRLYKQDPKAATEFRALVGGDRPETVRDIMKGGPENESFAGAFAGDPTRLNAMQQTAREIKNLNRMSTLTGEGRTAANELIGRERPMFARAATRFGLSAFPPARIAADAAQTAMTSALAPRVQQQLATGALGGRNMLALMNQYPTSVRASEMISQLSPETRNALAQLVRSGTFTLNQPPE